MLDPENYAQGERILVSACLLGEPCRWHGRPSPSSALRRLLRERPDLEVRAVCPEVLGGLPVPRKPVKRRRGRVYETCRDKEARKFCTGRDVTAFFVHGAKRTRYIAKRNHCRNAILCKWSPSCDINGITGRMLTAAGIEIVNTW